MKIYKEVIIPFEGTEYTSKGSFALINKIEQRVNLRTFEQQCMIGSPRLTDVAWIVYSALVTAGCKCSYDDVGHYLLSQDPVKYNGADTDTSILYGELAMPILESCFPSAPEAEDSADSEDKKKPQ